MVQDKVSSEFDELNLLVGVVKSCAVGSISIVVVQDEER
jgi:hypothetical protein